MSARAGILITGTEVLTGRVQDRNGPWLSDRLTELGIDLAHVTIVGDRPEDMLPALRFLAAQDVDIIVTSGGLGPTADDLTVEVVAEFCGREMYLDGPLEERIAEILRPLAKRYPQFDQEAVRESNRKQAVVPRGATIIDPVGTAPGLVVPPAEGEGPTVVVLPGPPRELQPMWRSATATEAFAQATGTAIEYRTAMLRMFGIPESEIAATLRAAPEAGVGLGRPRDHHVPAQGRDRGRDPLRAGRPGKLRRARGAGARPSRRHALLRRRHDDRRPGRAAARRRRVDYRRGGVVHGRPARGAAHGASRVRPPT